MDPKLRLITSDTIEPQREPTEHERVAAEVSALLREVAARIPKLAAPNARNAKRVRAARTIRREYVVTMIRTVENDDRFAAAKFDPADARDALEFNDEYRPVADQIAILLASLRYTMGARMAGVIEKALRAYDLAKGVAEIAEDDLLRAQLELVARDLNRKNKPKKKKE